MPDPDRSGPKFTFTRADFPEGFVFGTATSAYQIEGSAAGGAGPSHWDTFAATPGNTARGEGGSLACDHLHRWREDLDLVRDSGVDAYRFSLSWARLMPEGRGAPNAAGLDFYDALIDGMLERGLQPWATLYHWELPAALADQGGWRNRDIAGWFADYAELVTRRFGDRLHGVATINEPWCVAWLSHFLGIHAPGTRDIRAAARAMHHVLLAHGRAIDAMRGMGQENLGIVLNFEYAAPATDGSADRQAARRQDAIYNRWFINAIMSGSYPAEALDGLAPHLPPEWQEDMAVIGAKLDWLGVNYYTRKLLAHDPDSAWPSIREVEGPLPKTDLGWEIYPEGLYHFLTWLNRIAAPRVPLYVTENGLADATFPDDPARVAYLDGHLAAARRAISQGVPLKGYFIWSLMDNYEWSAGYDMRFGLVHVDFDTLQRTPKASFHALQRAIGPA